MRKGIIMVTILYLLTFVSLYGEAHAGLAFTPGSVRVYTDNIGYNGFVDAGRYLVIRVLITPSGSGTTAEALQGSVLHPLNFSPQPLSSLSNLYTSRTPYSGETGTWLIVAKYGDTETAVTTTYPLDDPRLLPLATNLSVSGPLLTPTLTWNPFDQKIYPSFNYPSAGELPPVGYDFYMQVVTIRLAESGMPIVYQSSPLSTDGSSYTIPAGVLSENKEYLFDLMLTHNDVYSRTPWRTDLESVSETFVYYSTNPVPEDELVLNFGPAYGLYQYDQAGGWKQWNTINPSQMVTVDLNGDGTDELVAAFPGYGLYTYDSANGWQLINTEIPEGMISFRNGIACDFGAAFGLWLWDKTGAWQQINTIDPEKMIAADIDGDGQDELIVSFIGMAYTPMMTLESGP